MAKQNALQVSRWSEDTRKGYLLKHRPLSPCFAKDFAPSEIFRSAGDNDYEG